MPAIDPNLVAAAAAPDTGVNPLITVKSNSQLAADDKAKAMAEAQTPHVSRLAAWTRQKWEAAKRAKFMHEMKMLQDLRQRNGEYDPEDLATIKNNDDPDIYMMLTATQCRAAAAWIKDVLLPADDKPWGIDPTPIPDLPPDLLEGLQQSAVQMLKQDVAMMLQQFGAIDVSALQQMKEQARQAVEQVSDSLKQHMNDEAEVRARRMEEKIEDQLREGGFYDALDECIDDLVTFPAAIMCGPEPRVRKTLRWVQDQNGQYTAQIGEEILNEFRRVSPLDIYPFPQTADLQRGGFFERRRFVVEELAAMIGVPGYSESAIRAVIDDFGKGGLREWIPGDATRAIIEGRPQEFLTVGETIEAAVMWGRVPGTLLLDFGMPESEVPDRSLAYDANVWLIGPYVVRAALNPHPTGKRPYGVASYENIPGSIWGKGIPRLMQDCQRICNATARGLAKNIAMGASAQVAINDTSRIPIGEEITQIYPGKIWQFGPDARGAGGAPIQFFQPDMNVQPLLAIFDHFYRVASDMTGVIPSAYGSDNAAGAGKTASGQAMLLSNANKIMRGVIGSVDTGVIEPIISHQFVYNMMFDDDTESKGDLKITARGSSALVVKEQAQLRQREFLQLLLSSPQAQQITGLEGIRSIMAETAKTLQLPKNVVPTEDELQQAAQQIAIMQMMQQGNTAGAMQQAGAQNGQPLGATMQEQGQQAIRAQ